MVQDGGKKQVKIFPWVKDQVFKILNGLTRCYEKAELFIDGMWAFL